MLPQVLAILQEVFPEEERARALGLYGATAGRVLGGIAEQDAGAASAGSTRLFSRSKC